MRSTQILFLFAATFLTQSVVAQSNSGASIRDVNVVNTPDVNVANAPDVNVINDATNPLPVLNVNDAMQPFQTRLFFTITPGSTQKQISIPIPAGKRLITEHVSSRVQGPTGQQFLASISIAAFHNGVNAGIFYMVFTLQGTFSGIDLFTASQPMRVYADSTASNIFIVTRTSSVGSAFAEVDISGYLVDL